jgi:hypothetical protein
MAEPRIDPVATANAPTCAWYVPHRWSLWEDEADLTVHPRTGDPVKDTAVVGIYRVQHRRCVECNMLQVRRVHV